MDDFLKNIINEKFASKAQQRYFYAKAGDKSLKPTERKKWKKWASEFSDETNFKKIPEKTEKKEEEINELVDENGDIIGKTSKSKKLPTDFNTKEVTDKKTTDDIVYAGHGSMGNTASTGFGRGTIGQNTIWESDLESSLGYEDTLEKDLPYEKALKYFIKKLGLPEDEAKERLEKMGYIPEKKDKIRLIEAPKKFIEEYLDELLSKKNISNDIVSKKDIKEVNPIIQKQLKSLKDSLTNNGLTINDIISYLKDE